MGVQECLFKAAVRDDLECKLRLRGRQPLSEAQICFLVVVAHHGKMQDWWQKCALMVGMANSVLNPVIYAFWYSQFRLRIVKAWKSCFQGLAKKLCGSKIN